MLHYNRFDVFYRHINYKYLSKELFENILYTRFKVKVTYIYSTQLAEKSHFS